MATSVNLIDVMRLRKVFKEKKWNDNTNEDTVFNNFSILLGNLERQQQKELMHELIENYLWLPSSQYEPKFNTLFNEFIRNNPKCRRIYLVPIVKANERQKIKSGDHCVYLVDALLKLNPNFQHISKQVIHDFKVLFSKNIPADGSEIVLFIDDFVGTGNSFSDGWLDIIANNPTVVKENSVVLTLVILQTALDYIANSLNLLVLYSELRKKGITDFYSSLLLKDKLEIMEEIEKIIEPPPDYKFGYDRSEALVTVIKTPNNTFPVFWKKYTIKGQQYQPPFLRK